MADHSHDLCGCCNKVVGKEWVRSAWVVPGRTLEYTYCDNLCKELHRLRLIREAGL